MADTDIMTQGRHGFHFTNWSTTYSCSPDLYFEPQTEEEIKQILSLARSQGKKVKTVGCGHSPSDLACTSDIMMSLNKFNQLVQVDKENLHITVQGGCTLNDMNDLLAKHGLAFPVLGAVSEVSAAGVIATAVHGSGKNYGTMSSYVVSMKLMLASGEIIMVSKKERQHLFPAVAVNLGCLGVILEVTFQCEKAFRLKQHQYPAPLKDVIEHLDTQVGASDHFKFLWFPHTDNVMCIHASRTTEKRRRISSWFWAMFVGFHLLQFLLYLTTFLPSMVPFVNNLYFKILSSPFFTKGFVDRSDKVFNFNCLFKQYVMEWSIPREKAGVVLIELKEWIERTGFPAHFPVEVRFVKRDDLFLSPCYHQDSCYMNIIMYRPYNKLTEFSPYWDQFQQIVTKYGGRPHWAKDHKVTATEFKRLYPKWDEFCEIRQKLDPAGMFLNSYLERVFEMEKPATNGTSASH